MGLSFGSWIGIGVAAAFFCWFFLRRLCVDTTPRNRHVYEALRSPSVRGAASALERRIALAVREASQDARVCKICAFANTTRMKVASCALCGAPLPLLPKHGIPSLFQPTPAPPKDEEIVHGPSKRQRRVRRRREWARLAGPVGSVVWSHDPQFDQEPSDIKFPSYIIHSDHPEPIEAAKPTVDSADDITITVETPVEADSALPRLANELVSQLTNTRISVVGVHPSYPASVAFTSSTGSATDGQLAYPAKLVQFMTSVAGLLSETTTAEIPSVARFSIARDQVWIESVEAMASMTPDQVRYPIRVEFIGEPGIDAGALYREWIGLMNKAMATPEAGIFTCVDPHEQTFYLNAQSRDVLGENHLVHFLVAGRLLGRSLLDGNVTGFQLAPPLLKIMLGLPISFHDLEFYDAEAFKSLQWLITNDNVDMLGLDFTVVEKLPDGNTRVVELVPGGSEIDVTDANKMEYIDRKLQYLLFESVQSQLFAFLTGLYEVVPADLLTTFDAEELGLLLSGTDEIDVDDWEANTVAFVEGPERKPLSLLPCYDNFWKVVREMTNDERRRLLHFATGSTRPPPGGFSSLTSYDGRLALFTLRGVPEDTARGHLQSHACFNRVDLPTYWTYKPMRAAMFAAISFDEDGFTIQ